jgi:hypothetical protein
LATLWKYLFFLRIHPSRCINHIGGSTPKTGKPLPTKGGSSLRFTWTTPPIHDTGSSKPKESLRNNLARRQLLYSSRTLILIASTSGRAPLNTTSLRCLQMHQKSKMMEVHKTRCVALGQGREVHHCSISASAGGSQGNLSQRLSVHTQISWATTHPSNRCCNVSGTWSQRGQAAGRGSLRRARRSAIQHRPLETIHAKNLQP